MTFAQVLILFGAACFARQMLLNDIQIKGTQLSFHVASNNTIPFLNFTHASIANQLSNSNVQAIELKFRFYNGQFQVFNARGVDEMTTCPNVSLCMQQIYQYTTATPSHNPIFVIVEPANDTGVEKTEWTRYLWDWLDNALTISWPSSKILTPYEVQGSFSSLQEAITTRGWPSLKSSIGRVVFLLRVDPLSYYTGITNLSLRVGFPIYSLGSSDDKAVVFEEDSPVVAYKDIQKAVSKNFLIVTKSDYNFVPSSISAWNSDTFFAAADSDSDGAVTLLELSHLFVDSFSDAEEPTLSTTRQTALDTAVFKCATASAKSVSKSQFACILEKMTLYLPTPEGLVATKARFASALMSGAQIILTKYADVPFKGAPSSEYWWSTLSESCNSLTTCECQLDSAIASDTCHSGSPRAHSNPNVPSLTSALLLLALNLAMRDARPPRTGAVNRNGSPSTERHREERRPR